MTDSVRSIAPAAPPLVRKHGGLACDTRGVAIVEFAIVAAPFIALLIAILQTSLVFFVQQNLETTAEKSVRQLMTGEAQKAGMGKAAFKESVCKKLPAFMKCENLMVDVQTAASFGDAAPTAPVLTMSGNTVTNNWKYTPGGPGTINVVRVMYVWNVQAGPLGFDLATMSTGQRLLFATAVFKTEPYS
jgi:Flp pilus assembly protein TadG